ncbi:MAG: YceI family protein [Desulfobulbus sp.]|nr:YceI family protein [Desulfobulbus sp.]
MHYFRSLILSFALLTLLVPGAMAAARTWDVDTVHSNVYFSIDHIFSKVHGRFKEVQTEIAFDPTQLEQSRFAFTLKVDSVDTGEPKRDKHLLSPDFFDSGKFALITFTSKAITDGGNGVYNVAGTLTVKGEAHDLTLPLTFNGIKDHPAAKGKEVIGFNGHIILDRLALKVGSGKFYKMGLIGKDVDVLVTLEALANK